ncbi:MAG TPA: sugar ABC transporter permease [Actinocrinis sp.]|nr:sugar ABC transporter permease [Actinocrinis sp.]
MATPVLALPGRGRKRAGLPAALRAKRRREGLAALGFLSPWLLGFSVFFAYPLLAAVYFSFYYYDQFNAPVWVGLKNWDYILFNFPDFVTGLQNTLWLVVVMVTLQTVFGLGVAMLITKIKRGGNIFRTLFYLPYLAPPVISTLVFVYLFDAGGPINAILAHVGVHNPPGWFNSPTWFKPSLTLLSLWGIGNTVVIFFASLLDVPKEQMEAAMLDGAGPVKRFRFVTLPAIQPVILFSVVTGVIYTMQYYTQAIVAGEVASGHVATAGTTLDIGYPLGASLTVPQLIYQQGILNANTGPACVLSILLFAMTMLFTLILLRRKNGLVGAD